ncbi:hypothetical protein MA16_Dca001415 [Dendrobium catenatum]|uniref:Uncharacterized protein n=1 Tax=Dendrobium catenatum TaxID=906689 RepID=A0A2I0WMB8_9ASPA|nr:hypothetical protein MA16_Dca001415 [Dendrobium catenatum]
MKWRRKKRALSACSAIDESGSEAFSGLRPVSVSAGCCNCLISQFMRKLKKRCLMFCMEKRPEKYFNCSYDPLSYRRNFDSDGCGEDEYFVRFDYTCSESAALYYKNLTN